MTNIVKINNSISYSIIEIYADEINAYVEEFEKFYSSV